MEAQKISSFSQNLDDFEGSFSLLKWMSEEENNDLETILDSYVSQESAPNDFSQEISRIDQHNQKIKPLASSNTIALQSLDLKEIAIPNSRNADLHFKKGSSLNISGKSSLNSTQIYLKRQYLTKNPEAIQRLIPDKNKQNQIQYKSIYSQPKTSSSNPTSRIQSSIGLLLSKSKQDHFRKKTSELNDPLKEKVERLENDIREVKIESRLKIQKLITENEALKLKIRESQRRLSHFTGLNSMHKGSASKLKEEFDKNGSRLNIKRENFSNRSRQNISNNNRGSQNVRSSQQQELARNQSPVNNEDYEKEKENIIMENNCLRYILKQQYSEFKDIIESTKQINRNYFLPNENNNPIQEIKLIKPQYFDLPATRLEAVLLDNTKKASKIIQFTLKSLSNQIAKRQDQLKICQIEPIATTNNNAFTQLTVREFQSKPKKQIERKGDEVKKSTRQKWNIQGKLMKKSNSSILERDSYKDDMKQLRTKDERIANDDDDLEQSDLILSHVSFV